MMCFFHIFSIICYDVHSQKFCLKKKKHKKNSVRELNIKNEVNEKWLAME